MILRDTYYPPAQGASGVGGFFGNPAEHKEYKHSSVIRFMYGDIFEDMGFVAKTATFLANKGYVELAEDGFSFRKFLPNAIYPMLSKQAALNAVGLSNSGFEFLLKLNIWQQRTEPFMLSFMPMGNTADERTRQTESFIALMQNYLPYFKTKIALQVNLSCPNTKHGQKELIGESVEHFNMLGTLNIPLIPKINALLSPEIAHRILDLRNCDALCFSNSIPFGELPDQIDWTKYGRKGKSPLEKYGYPKGGLTGAPIFPVVEAWLHQFTKINSETKPIIAGGGVMSEDHVHILSRFPSVQAISIGTVAFTRPWRVKGIIKACYKYLVDD
jgi:dihydroorotate dehydrogenase